MTTHTEKHSFQTEVKQVLDIVINSLYTDKEIFVRELVSNASDALEKMRHIELTEKEVYDADLASEINITTDDQAHTITIQDFGVGMTHLELVENLGTIAHSGSKAFIKAMEENGSASENLIGQFGVGFYSVFMVAKEVEVYTHSWDPSAEGCVWKSDGTESYSIDVVPGQRRGCKMVIRLKDEYKEFATKERMQSILERYSSFVQFPIHLNGDRVNTIEALWLKNKNEITEEEYEAFYKFQSKGFEKPITWVHFAADAPLAINALLFVPGENVEQFGFGRMEPGVSLYCRKVLIDGSPEGLLPEWMRFVRGVVDSADIPLNISRESMQDSALIQKLHKVIVRRFIKHLDALAKDKPEAYADFWAKFSPFIKEGVAMDYAHREALGQLLRFESSFTEAGKHTSLEEYLIRMPEDQKDIYFAVGHSREAIESGPYYEAFKARGIEVVYCYEPSDELVMTHLGAFKEKSLTSIEQDNIDLPECESSDDKESLSEEDKKSLAEWMQSVLPSNAVKEVSFGDRLIDSPALILNTDRMMTANMRRWMQAMQKEGEMPSTAAVNFQINPKHKLIKRIFELKTSNAELATQVTEQVFDNAMAAAGLLDDVQPMVNRMYRLLERISQ